MSAAAPLLAHARLLPSDLLLLTPRQRRLLRPLRRPDPLCRVLLASVAFALDPLWRLDAAIDAYHHTFFDVLHPAPRYLLAAGTHGDRHGAD